MPAMHLYAIDAAVTEPLLPAHHSGSDGGSSAAASSGGSAASRGARQQQEQPQQPTASNLQFSRRFKALIRLLRPYPALFLALLAVAEAVVVAEVGKVAGSFYLIVVDRQPAKLASAMLRASMLYAASTVLYAVSCWATESLALSWRRRLTTHLHHRYCQHQHAFYFLQRPAQPAPQQPQLQQQQQQQGNWQSSQEGQGMSLHQHQQDLRKEEERGAMRQGVMDNPDQRIASDAAELCDCLSDVARVAAAAPFKLLYYSWLTGGYLGWRGLVAVYIFFWLAGLVQRLAVAPVARLVFQQERREGDLRFAHLRLREYAAEVAQYRGESVEKLHLDATLESALVNQRRLVTWRSALAGTTRAVDYCGAMLNYACVGGAVFIGMAGAGSDSGQLAQFVSNASFATLTLIYTFTELLDLSDKLSRLGGLTARVGELLEALPGGSSHTGSGGSSSDNGSSSRAGQVAGGGGGYDMHAVQLAVEGRELKPSQLATTLQPPQSMSCLGGRLLLEVSVHRLGPDLQHEARAIFPDAPAAGQLLACITFQFAAGGLSLAPDSSSATLEKAAAEMDRMLDGFLHWEAAVRAHLSCQGCWCDAVDPRTGMALHGSRGSRWSEVAAAHALLGYERRDAGICPVVLHPQHGTSAYPATLFTDAPPPVLAAALAAVADLAPQPQPGPATSSPSPNSSSGSASSSSGLGGPLLVVRGVSVRTPAGGLAVAGLSLELDAGQHLLIVGPNGCGKSTFIKALCGLHPLEAGSLQLPAPSGSLLAPPGQSAWGPGAGPGAEAGAGAGVMFVPQRPLAAPGRALWQQICYPDPLPEPGSGTSSGTSSSEGGRWPAASNPAGSSSLAGSCTAAGGSGWQQGHGRPSDGKLLDLLQRVGLQYLLDRVGGSFQAAADWAVMLSPGELQRLSVARVMHRRPALAVLDEVTSAVSQEAAQQLYRQLHEAGITCISIAQDCQHMRRLHPMMLHLGGGPQEGAWQLMPSTAS